MSLQSEFSLHFESDTLCRTAGEAADRWGASWSPDPTRASIMIRCDSHSSLDAHIESEGSLAFEEAIALFDDVSVQLASLLGLGYAPQEMSLSTISVLKLGGDRLRFWISPGTRLEELRDGGMTIVRPFRRHRFMAPEMVLIRKLPHKLDPASNAYSLGVLVYFCLAGEILSPDNKGEHLSRIAGTPLCAAIERTLEKDPSQSGMYYL